MNFFSSIGHFFKSLFGANSDVAQTVLHDVSSFTQLAEPIVREVETIKAAPQNTTLEAVQKFLAKYEPDLAKVQQIAGSLTGLSSADLFRQVAVIALQTFVPAGTASSLLNLAVELAYSIFKQKSAAVPKAA